MYRQILCVFVCVDVFLCVSQKHNYKNRRRYPTMKRSKKTIFVKEEEDDDDYQPGIDVLERQFHRTPSSNMIHLRDVSREDRPMWVSPCGYVYIETFHPFFMHTRALVSLVAEPVSRAESIHVYRITAYSLFAAAASSITADEIIKQMRKVCKHNLTRSVTGFIRTIMAMFGKLFMVTKDDGLYLEATDPKYITKLREDENFRSAQIYDTATETETKEKTTKDLKKKRKRNLYDDYEIGNEDVFSDDVNLDNGRTHVKVHNHRASDIKMMAWKARTPILEQIELTKKSASTKFQLYEKTQLRPFQSEALRRMFADSVARSGVIVLPCGAGKTLTGIAAMCTIGRITLIFCPNNLSCTQWKDSIMQYTTLGYDRVKIVNSTTLQNKDLDLDTATTDVVLTTYTLIGLKDDNRAEHTLKAMQKIRSIKWGFLILDEVHIAPASSFTTAIQSVRCECKLGLTATLVREDDQINELNFLIGPKLYEADWMELTEQGYLSKVECREILCPMSSIFMACYLRETDPTRRYEFCAMNTNKFAACEKLMKRHEALGDKILIFIDLEMAITHYAVTLKRFFMFGKTTNEERQMLIDRFRLPSDHENAINTLFLSSVGDVAIDLPMANVLIQVCGHHASRRQEAQRLGRIIRPKPKWMRQTPSVFYSLVSTDTDEVIYCRRRKQYVIDQGYTYRQMSWSELMGFAPSGIAVPDAHPIQFQMQMARCVASLTNRERQERNGKMAEYTLILPE